MDLLQQVFPIAQQGLWVGFAVFVRIGAMMAVLPAFGDQPVPTRVRLVLAILFSLIVTPAIAQTLPDLPQDLRGAVALLGPEVIAGLFFGLMIRLFVLALQIAGSIAAQASSLTQIFGGTAVVDPQPAIGHVLVVAGTALIVLLGLHVHVARYMIESYQIVPFATPMPAGIVAEAGLEQVSRIFALGFSLAAPFLIASLLYNVVLGVINRAMPLLMVSFVGAPALTAGGLFLFFLSAPLMLKVWSDAVMAFLAQPLAN